MPSIDSFPPSNHADINAHEIMSTATTKPLLDEAVTETYPTWVTSPLIPRFREEAPSLDKLCTNLIATLKSPQPDEASIQRSQASKDAPPPSSNGHQNSATQTTPDNPIPPTPTVPSPSKFPPNHTTTIHLDDTLNAAFPAFTTYTDLATLSTHPHAPLRALAARTRAIFLAWLAASRTEATWVTPNILLDGILTSLDPATLTQLCEAHAFTHVALLSIHPDDWVVGGAWKAHGVLPWTRRDGDGALVAPRWEDAGLGRRASGVLVQRDGIALRSPVIDQLVVPLEDGAGASLLVHLRDICTFIGEHAKRPGALVVVNCKMGLSRSNAAQEAFVLREVCRRLREEDADGGWAARGVEGRTAALSAVLKRYREEFRRRRGELKDKFPRQMEGWARFLAEGEPEEGPKLVSDEAAVAGGEGMRDAAIVACYQVNSLLPESLVVHYYKRTGTGKGRAEPTISKFREAEEKLRGDWEEGADDGPGSRAPWLPLSQFVDLCRSTHQSRSPRDKVDKPPGS